MSYVALATTTLGSAASSVTFSSIDQSYGDLVLVINGTVSANTTMGLEFNGDTGSNYTYVRVVANSGGVSTASGTEKNIGNFFTSNSVGIFQIMDYSATDKYKTTLCRTNGAGDNIYMVAMKHASTSAISSVEIINQGVTTFSSGTTFSLYGVAK